MVQIFFHINIYTLKFWELYFLTIIHVELEQINMIGMANSVNPDQTAVDLGLCCLSRPICINI